MFREVDDFRVTDISEFEHPRFPEEFITLRFYCIYITYIRIQYFYEQVYIYKVRFVTLKLM